MATHSKGHKPQQTGEQPVHKGYRLPTPGGANLIQSTEVSKPVHVRIVLVTLCL